MDTIIANAVYWVVGVIFSLITLSDLFARWLDYDIVILPVPVTTAFAVIAGTAWCLYYT